MCRFMCFLVFSEERNDWISILSNALKLHSLTSQSQVAVAPEKCGYLELRGYKAKIFTVLKGSSVWLCKNEQVSFIVFITNCYIVATVFCLSFEFLLIESYFCIECSTTPSSEKSC